nr:protein kinase-like domain, beta-lactamase/transpeptidase-like protein [Tanacetum cinerariifolium]
MSSLNHPTSNIEDVFSSNFLDYTTASPNYFPASPGNISPDPPDNLSKYLLASLAISPFHYMQAYNDVANKPPISPQDPITPLTILTPSLVLPPSPLFDPRHFFVPKKLLPPKKQIHPLSSSLNSSRKQACNAPSMSSGNALSMSSDNAPSNAPSMSSGNDAQGVIVIKAVELDFGLKPFRIFNIWMEELDFFCIVKEVWRKEVRSTRPHFIFRDKLKNVKACLKLWSKDMLSGHQRENRNAKRRSNEMGARGKKRVLTNSERTLWMEARKQWEDKEKEFDKMLRKSLELGEVQNAFIKVRFILDGVLIAKETMEFLKKKNEQGLIFKVDFEKATSSMSILVNGSPSEEFGLERGVRQGDPLPLFLFILAAEGLNVIVTEAVEKGIFRGVVVGANKVKEVSSLKVNYNKSKIYDIGVNEGDITDMERWMGCHIGEFPFTYLGLPIGKWWWRFRIEGTSLWVRVIKSIHENSKGLGKGRASGRGGSGGGVWNDIVQICEEIDGMRVDFIASFIEEIGGRMVMWGIKGRGLMRCSVGNGIGLEALGVKDKWRWMLDKDGEFTVRKLSRCMDEKILHVESGGQETIWNKLVPRKVNIFVWRALKKRLSVRVELDRRVIDVDSVLYRSCKNVVETYAHCLVTCDLATSEWEKNFNWWKVGSVNAFSIDDLFSSNGGVNVSILLTHFWQAVI